MRTFLASVIVGVIAIAAIWAQTTRQRTAPGTQPAGQPLKPVEMRYGDYVQRLDELTTITADGTLRCVTTNEKSYGPSDIDKKHERVEIREGKLTLEQVADLAHLFDGWGGLSSENYPGVPDGGEARISYGNKTVTVGGGSAAPQQVNDVQKRIRELARQMPIVQR